MICKLGAMKDIIDDRDYMIAKFLAPIELPDKCDMSGRMKPVRNQGNEGTCVAFATAAVKESEEFGEEVLSPRFIYDRVGLPGGGAYPRDAMKVLCDEGICPESCQPYYANVNNRPCDRALELAKPNKIKAYARLTTLEEMKQCLVQNGPFMIAVKVTDKWYGIGVNGVIEDGGNVVGGHAIVFVGYDDNTGMVKIRNSWGTGWGQEGYGYIKYEMLMTILMDTWSSVDIPQNEEEGNTIKPVPKPRSFWAWLLNILAGFR